MKNFYQKTGLIAMIAMLFSVYAATMATAEEKTPATKANDQTINMYKSPTCACCADWAKHMRSAGFTVTEHKREDMNAIKKQYGVPRALTSCHTALIGGYIIEGHVPAKDVARLLKERPNIVGLTAPGMPMKSPGMQKEGLAPQSYDVLSFNSNGKTKVFAHY
ncbi:MAG: DUF411 domain-containing protein [Mariprofundaceae bacterium]|nr:DUF411 domain-containing protein [Mariprofundaceae bacterium]